MWFECESCGATQNADYVGAKNIGWRFVRRGLQSSRRTGDSQSLGSASSTAKLADIDKMTRMTLHSASRL
ncbi:hypothetical protein C500_15025 [Natrialba magadii ATCC 43099]|uniref:Transposase n=1 Tax=Natrialba magadii (strain ATCC 43099 / DSM 3394 / CCM 3739 / CIP 104546 / IAM 13178 / JCM 8861 / NBRC 102185 / NCIMB 2190 / MS3) TaxID=547559 RepID=L9UP57_NATMM|nr:hypothetical protein C500_15025 [Natrialba magadii ATCC 43099]